MRRAAGAAIVWLWVYVWFGGDTLDEVLARGVVLFLFFYFFLLALAEHGRGFQSRESRTSDVDANESEK